MKSILDAKYSTIEKARSTGRGHGIVLEFLKSVLGMFLIICVTGSLTDLICALILEDVTQEPWATILVLYGDIFGIAAGILYCAVFERRNIHSVGFQKPVAKPYFEGAVLGAILITLTVLLGTVFGGFRFSHMNTDADMLLQLLLLGGFVIQGMSEEVLFRGYMFVSMARKNSIAAAVLGNSVLFSLIHAFNDGFTFLPFLNILLFGILESLLFLKTDSIWAAGAIHSVWNYMQGCVFGLNVSGNTISDSLFVFERTENAAANGGAFGPEGSVVVTAVVAAAIVFLARRMKNDIPQSGGSKETE